MTILINYETESFGFEVTNGLENSWKAQNILRLDNQSQIRVKKEIEKQTILNKTKKI